MEKGSREMHAEYHKINSVYKRDPSGKQILWGEFSDPETEFLKDCRWVWTEKVDGTNIRVSWSSEGVRFGGKTDEAQIPATLIVALQELFHAEVFAGIDGPMTLYGEGYGAKIQKAGSLYLPNEQSFVLFDVRVGDWWLRREDVEDLAKRLFVNVVPIVGEGTIGEMLSLVEKGFKSAWGDFTAEGLVARPAVELKTRAGRRIITKMKHRDFAGRG